MTLFRCLKLRNVLTACSHIICINDLIMTSSADYIKNKDIIKLHSSMNNSHWTHACMQDTINVYMQIQSTDFIPHRIYWFLN